VRHLRIIEYDPTSVWTPTCVTHIVAVRRVPPNVRYKADKLVLARTIVVRMLASVSTRRLIACVKRRNRCIKIVGVGEKPTRCSFSIVTTCLQGANNVCLGKPPYPSIAQQRQRLG